uniref:Uncharacterized protein n=1 Tax=Arundo donax TaxID=35708 RepID=A0A0A9G7K6_ARUDO
MAAASACAEAAASLPLIGAGVPYPIHRTPVEGGRTGLVKLLSAFWL